VVDGKSTVVNDLLGLLLLDVLPDHLACDRTGTDCQIAAPTDAAPRTFSVNEQTPVIGPMSECLSTTALSDSRPGSDDRRETGEHGACYLAGQDLQFVFRRHLAQEIAHTKSDFTGQDRFTILRHPHQMHLEVALRVRAQPVMSHATT
jgi:hypothetical protein